MHQLSSIEIDDYLKVALALADNGGAVLKRFWGNLSDIRDKEYRGDLVTEADKESERSILGILKSVYPTHSVLAEESGRHNQAQSSFLWVIDPLDGTTNYAHQYPMVAVSVALLYYEHPLVGVVFNPIQNELFYAAKGSGAFLNGQPIGVSKVFSLNQSLLTSGFAYDRQITLDNNYAEFCHLTDLTQGVRRGGSAALDMAYVAAGRFDGYWERGIKPWDIAAGTLLVEEAGGKVTAYDESSLNLYEGRILATNGHIHHELSQELINLNKSAVKIRLG